MKPKHLLFLMLIGTFLSPLAGKAQQILFDRGVRAGELSVFPTLGNPNEYYYLPDKVQIAKHEDGTPMFSFLKYVRNTDVEGGANTITESDQAGGVVHAVVALSVPDDVRREAETALRRVNSSGKLMGPILYKSGKIALISSIISSGELTKKVVGIGNAPVLDGQKAAVSVLLTKEGADILWATFQTSTPDLSFQFEMEASGYLSPKNVTIEANFEQIYSHKAFEAAAVTPVFAGEIKTAFDDLSNSGAIKVTQIGEDEDLNKLKETAYNRLVALMFEKVGGQNVTDLNSLNPSGTKSMVDRATEMLNKARSDAQTENNRREAAENSRRTQENTARREARTALVAQLARRGVDTTGMGRNTGGGNTPRPQAERVSMPAFAVAASFVMKKIKRSGKYLINLNKYTEDTRTFPFSENVGNIFQNCEQCFTKVNLDDDLYKQRGIIVSLTDVNSPDFGNYITSVEVGMRKKHENGSTTTDNVVITKNRFNEDGNNFSMMYGWKGDNNRDQWLQYEYNTKWDFSGGFSVESDWAPYEFASISLSPPLEKKTLFVDIDPDLVTDEAIRTVELKVYYKNGNREELKTMRISTKENVLSGTMDLILPRNSDDFEYEVVWFVKGKPPIRVARKPYNLLSLYLYEIEN